MMAGVARLPKGCARVYVITQDAHAYNMDAFLKWFDDRAPQKARVLSAATCNDQCALGMLTHADVTIGATYAPHHLSIHAALALLAHFRLAEQLLVRVRAQERVLVSRRAALEGEPDARRCDARPSPLPYVHPPSPARLPNAAQASSTSLPCGRNGSSCRSGSAAPTGPSARRCWTAPSSQMRRASRGSSSGGCHRAAICILRVQ